MWDILNSITDIIVKNPKEVLIGLTGVVGGVGGTMSGVLLQWWLGKRGSVKIEIRNVDLRGAFCDCMIRITNSTSSIRSIYWENVDFCLFKKRWLARPTILRAVDDEHFIFRGEQTKIIDVLPGTFIDARMNISSDGIVRKGINGVVFHFLISPNKKRKLVWKKPPNTISDKDNIQVSSSHQIN